MNDRYVFFSTSKAHVSLDVMRDALNRLDGVVAFDSRAPEIGNQSIIYLESSADDEFSADIWCETGEEVAVEIEQILESLSKELPERSDGMLSIIYNNEDDDTNQIHERIERCLVDITHGVLYVPETGEVGW